MSLTIRQKESQDEEWIRVLLREHWGSEKIVINGRIIYPSQLPAYIAVMDDQPVGLVTYTISSDECEIITLNSIRSGEGIGTQLLNAVTTTARTAGCKLIHLYTTNDNINALRFYQKYGFQLVNFIKNGVDTDREIKPEIPKISKSGIPISDYLELAMKV